MSCAHINHLELSLGKNDKHGQWCTHFRSLQVSCSLDYQYLMLSGYKIFRREGAEMELYF